jgi:soluble epoxide hydrolase/lipid-phosphate phosphatase
LTAEDGPAVCKDNADRLFTVLHGTGDTMKRFLCVKDALRNHLTGSEPSPEVRPYAQDPGFKKAFIERMRHDGFDAPLCWYKAAVFNFQHENDKNLPEGRDKLEVPVLYMGGKEDVVTRPEVMQPAIEKGLLPQLEKADMMAAGHWIPYEKTDEVAGNMAQWLRKNFAQ